jgi:hypothetical protein
VRAAELDEVPFEEVVIEAALTDRGTLPRGVLALRMAQNPSRGIVSNPEKPTKIQGPDFEFL